MRDELIATPGRTAGSGRAGPRPPRRRRGRARAWSTSPSTSAGAPMPDWLADPLAASLADLAALPGPGGRPAPRSPPGTGARRTRCC